ncbi:MAG: DUF1573 domain-containing protein [Leadbetterella sp.]|jgi:Protein of unknown function (DUF1573)|nr:DUF1573 domain-containing protein [Leadbetterella sp.]
MKKGFLPVLILFMALSFWQCNSTSNSDTADGESQSDSAKIEFENPNHDFGEIKEGEVVSTVFKFKNVGSMPLNIVSVDVTCGCTVAEKPEKPIGAGKTGEIKVEFNSAGKAGINKKYVTVTSNAVNASEVVSFDVIVNKNEQ